MSDSRGTVTVLFGLAVLYLAGILFADSERRASHVVNPGWESAKSAESDVKDQASHAPDTSPINVVDDKRTPASTSSTLGSTILVPSHALCVVSALCRAIVQRDLCSVQKHVSALPRLASTKHFLGFYPLTSALLSGDPEIVQLIIAQAGVSPNCKTDACELSLAEDDILRSEFSANPCHRLISGATAMHYACMTNKSQMIQIICRVSNDFLSKDDSDKAPDDYIDSSSDEGFEALRGFIAAREQWETRRDSFGKILKSNHGRPSSPDFMHYMWMHGYQSPPVFQNTWTYLHVAVMNQYLPFIELIAEADSALVNTQGSEFHECIPFVHTHSMPYEKVDGATPLHLAGLIGNFEIIAVLLKSKADWNIKDNVGRTAHDYVLLAHGEDQAQAFKDMVEEEERRRQTSKKEKSPVDGENTENILGRADGEDKSRNDTESSSEHSMEDDGDNEMGDNDVKGKGLDIEKIIGAKIIGQRGPVRSVASAIRLRKNGWVDPDRPLVMLFLGSSGVGKTELAKQIAMYVYGEDGAGLNAGEVVMELESDSKFVRIDMSEYQQAHTVANLMGSPKGYVGYNDGGFLTTKLQENPRAIVLLDEIEKAHPDVLTLFLQVFDDGPSEEIKLHSSELREVVERTEDRHGEYTRVIGEFNRQIHPILKHALKRDEFLGRINQIVVFLPLNKEEISIVINNELKTWKARAKKVHGIDLDWSAEVVEKLAEGYDVNYGVRSVINEVRRTAVQSVAEAQIRGIMRKNYLAYLTIDALDDISLNSERRTGHIRSRNGCRYPLDCM
ncbi:P-loop containing nucleoside triphosphate hydrolase protein [Schizopora paradoxa]|uniref:p-loop containing nucleoside triphosphate hydrolase protein n=1 Tax=Schizopora paradoxa TaxID=27342 RepID=A0A0H2RA79_9AGAM|nr:P-loop containing nucleoside triphosphate hydrolase protein [Schizopora paradoxa]